MMKIQFMPYIIFIFVIVLGLSASYIDDARNNYDEDTSFEITQTFKQPYNTAESF